MEAAGFDVVFVDVHDPVFVLRDQRFRGREEGELAVFGEVAGTVQEGELDVDVS